VVNFHKMGVECERLEETYVRLSAYDSSR
jgi:hypothetical protein